MPIFLLTITFCIWGLHLASEDPGGGQRPQPTSDNVSYSIAEHDNNQNFRVRLNKRASEAELHEIATEIKSDHAGSHGRTAIFFYLPDTPIDDIAWATAHFDPDLKIRILGATASDVASSTALTRPASGEVVGSWIIDQFGGAYRTWIIRKNGAAFMESRDASSSDALTEPLVERRSPNGLRFDVPGSPAGDHWLVRPDGTLECRDNSGLIFTSMPIRD